MLEMATINGAHIAGLEDRTGSLTPGKQADIVLLDATALEHGAGDRPGRRGRRCAPTCPTWTP